MPELPEVEVCRRGLLPELQGEIITGVEVRFPRLRQALPEDLAQNLMGRRIADIGRRGKYLLFDCCRPGDPGWLLIHLGMSGNLRFVASDAPPERHDHFDLATAKRTLRFSDPRRFGLITWHHGLDPTGHPALAHLGIEPLSEPFSAEWLYTATRRRAAPIKSVLMDANTVVGIGNIYAAESLFRAGISPLRPAQDISRARYHRLVPAIRETLEDAIVAGGSSIRDYVHSDGGAGCFQVECAVYDRAGQPCRRCGGFVNVVRLGGRSTFYCPRCQK
ncbi:MAG: bifunctional DNA-formamidopyrimidine glycosylase/DNA-(apurinic or apyrimidinic site) lyase [Betaproteobacteria bacterium]